jgi:cyclopropane fatty-acyl-phospholipid synthase-like methyltransferase
MSKNKESEVGSQRQMASGQVSNPASIWDERYSGEEYHFGTEPNAFLVSQQSLLKPGMSCLAVADGEGRNGVWLAEQGLDVLSVDSSSVALEKARQLAQKRGVTAKCEQVDLMQWSWGENRFDVVAAIFIQFAPPGMREQMFAHIKCCLKPGGLLLLQGYTPRQLHYGTGGPSQAENLYTETMLREAFADMEIIELREHDDIISEGAGHSGMSALIDLVARKPG